MKNQVRKNKIWKFEKQRKSTEIEQRNTIRIRMKIEKKEKKKQTQICFCIVFSRSTRHKKRENKILQQNKDDELIWMCHVPWILFLEPFTKCAHSVRIRTDTTLDQDCVLEAAVHVCTACMIVSLLITCMNFNTPPLVQVAPHSMQDSRVKRGCNNGHKTQQARLPTDSGLYNSTFPSLVNCISKRSTWLVYKHSMVPLLSRRSVCSLSSSRVIRLLKVVRQAKRPVNFHEISHCFAPCFAPCSCSLLSWSVHREKCLKLVHCSLVSLNLCIRLDVHDQHWQLSVSVSVSVSVLVFPSHSVCSHRVCRHDARSIISSPSSRSGVWDPWSCNDRLLSNICATLFFLVLGSSSWACSCVRKARMFLCSRCSSASNRSVGEFSVSPAFNAVPLWMDSSDFEVWFPICAIESCTARFTGTNSNSQRSFVG